MVRAAERFEDPEGVESGDGRDVGAAGGELFQGLEGGRVGFPEEELLGLVARPAIRGSETIHERGGRKRRERRRGTGRLADGMDPVEPAAVLAETVVGQQVGLALLGQPVGVFDHVAVHVDDPERAIRSGARHDGAAPAVFGSEEVEGAAEAVVGGDEADAGFGDDVSLDEVVEGFAGEGLHRVA